MADPRTQSGPLVDVGSGRRGRVGPKSDRDTNTDPVKEASRTLVTPDAPDVHTDRTAEQDLPEAEEGPRSAVGLASSELAAALGDAATLLMDMSGADRGTLLAAVGLMGSTLLPFVGVPGDPWRPGIQAGGWVLVLLAVWALQLSAARARALGLLEGPMSDLADRETSTLRRISLWHLVCGAAAFAYCAYLVVFHLYLMDARTVAGVKVTPFIRPGLPVAAFFATGLSFAGLARFVADARRRRQAGRP